MLKRADIKAELIRSERITDPQSARGALLAQAASLFREHGYERTTVRALGRAAGVLPGSIFHYFQSKDEILRTLISDAIVLNIAYLRVALAAASTVQARLQALIEWELRAGNGETRDAWTVMVHEWRSLSPEGQRKILQLRDEYEQIWLGVLREAHVAGMISMDPAVVRRLVCGALYWTTTWYRPDGTVNLERLVEQILDLLLKPWTGRFTGAGSRAAAGPI